MRYSSFVLQINICEFPFFSFDHDIEKFCWQKSSFIINIFFVLYLLLEGCKHYEHINICLFLLTYALLLTASLLLSMKIW